MGGVAFKEKHYSRQMNVFNNSNGAQTVQTELVF